MKKKKRSTGRSNARTFSREFRKPNPPPPPASTRFTYVQPATKNPPSRGNLLPAASSALARATPFSCFQSSHAERRTTQRRPARRPARRRLAARGSFALTSVKAGGQSLRVLLLDVPLSSSAEELEGQTPEKKEKKKKKKAREKTRHKISIM